MAGYRYAPCAPSPNVSPAPHYPFYRTIPDAPPAPPVHISAVDRSAFLRTSPDMLTCTTDRGFRSGRGSVAVREGTWYYEAIVERGDGAGGSGKGSGDPGNPHVRIGWARREAGLDAPVGADAYGYGIRDVGGEKVHISRPKPYGKSFSTGDVIGCLIHLPPRPPVTSEDEPGYVRRWRIPLRYKGQLYFEMDEYPVAKEMEALVNREGKTQPVAHEDPEPKKKTVKKAPTAPEPATPESRTLTTLEGSYISFFLNGEPLGVAFSDIYDFLPLPPLVKPRRKFSHAYEKEREVYQYHDDGTLGYFPMVSCFGRGKVRVNFGPEWVRPADLPQGTRPLCDRYPDFRAEEELYDERDEAALAEKLKKDMEAAAAAAAAATNPPEPAAKRLKKKKKTPAQGEGTPGATPGPDPTPASSPRAASTPFEDVPTPAVSTPTYHEIRDPVVKSEPDDNDLDAHGEDAQEGVNWNVVQP